MKSGVNLGWIAIRKNNFRGCPPWAATNFSFADPRALDSSNLRRMVRASDFVITLGLQG